MALVPVLVILLLTTVTLSNGIYQFVREGSMAVLVCPYKPVYTWSDGHTMVIYTLHNEINYALTVSNRLAVSKETNLIIRNVTTEDAGIYRCTKLSSDVPVWHDIILGIRHDSLLNIHPSHAVCKTSKTAIIRCIHEHIENMAVLLHWNHYVNGFHIRRLNGSSFGNYSILSLEFCDYRDAGEYTCSVTLNGRFHSVESMLSIHGMPVITTKNASVNEEEIELSVAFFSDPDIQTFAWYVNNDKVDTNNRMFVKHSNVSVSIYGTNVSRKGYQTWILFDKKSAYDINNLTCRLSNGVDSSETSFSLKELLLILLSQDAEVTTIQDDGTTESQELSIHQYRMLMYIILPAVMCVFITGAVTCIIVYTMRKAKLGAHGAIESIATNRQDFPLENAHKDHGEAPFSSQYDEIDSTSYQSVTWRNYSLSDGNHSSGGYPCSVDDCEYISINSNKYDDLLESRCDLHQYNVCS